MSPSDQQWFKFDIPIFDEWIPKLSPEAGILFCVIMRKILAWDNKTEDTISVSQLMVASGMGERMVQRALKDLQESGCPLRKIGQSRNGSTYSCGVAPDTPGVSPVTPTTNVSTCNTNTIDSKLESTDIGGLASHAAKLVPSVLDRSSLSRMNFTRIEGLAALARNSGRVLRRAMATTCSEGASPGRTVRIHEPKDCQTSVGFVAERI